MFKIIKRTKHFLPELSFEYSEVFLLFILFIYFIILLIKKLQPFISGNFY